MRARGPVGVEKEGDGIGGFGRRMLGQPAQEAANTPAGMPQGPAQARMNPEQFPRAAGPQRAASVGPAPIRRPAPSPEGVDPLQLRQQYREQAQAAGRGPQRMAPVGGPQRAAEVGPSPVRRVSAPASDGPTPGELREQYRQKASAAGRGAPQAPQQPQAAAPLHQDQFGHLSTDQLISRHRKMATASALAHLMRNPSIEGVMRFATGQHLGAHATPFGQVAHHRVRQGVVEQRQAERAAARAPKPPRISG